MTRQNLKIHVKSEEESRQAQECLFDLGYKWADGKTEPQLTHHPYLFSYQTGTFGYCAKDEHYFENHVNKQVTLQELKEMLVLQRNDKNDATHKSLSGWLYYLGKEKAYCWNEDDERWFEACNCSENLKDILLEINKEGKDTNLISGEEAHKRLLAGKKVEYCCVEVDEWDTALNVNLGVFLNHAKFPDFKFREVHETIKIGNIEVQNPESEPLNYGQRYFIVDFTQEDLHSELTWSTHNSDFEYLKQGLIHLAADNAIAHAKALILISGGSIEE